MKLNTRNAKVNKLRLLSDTELQVFAIIDTFFKRFGTPISLGLLVDACSRTDRFSYGWAFDFHNSERLTRSTLSTLVDLGLVADEGSYLYLTPNGTQDLPIYEPRLEKLRPQLDKLF